MRASRARANSGEAAASAELATSLRRAGVRARGFDGGPCELTVLHAHFVNWPHFRRKQKCFASRDAAHGALVIDSWLSSSGRAPTRASIVAERCRPSGSCVSNCQFEVKTIRRKKFRRHE
ncbi:hypothetical protein FGB62_99g14 [Gracilaria domingensis]|nr:hypothetical protein FGB62_99g14 [Gracilaria domingensis]